MAGNRRRIRIAMTAGALSLALFAGGCESFDLTDLFPDGKKKLAGERRPVFPDGVPGVPQGVPPELMKGYQPPENAADPAAAVPPPEAAPEEKPKPAPKPRRAAARPKPQAAPAPAEPAPQQSAQPAWPAQPQPQQSAWPAAPAPGTFSR